MTAADSLFLHVGVNQMRYESAERDYHAAERDFEPQRGMYPIYDYQYWQGVPNSPYNHPKWYIPPATLDTPDIFSPYGFPLGIINSFFQGRFSSFYARQFGIPPYGRYGSAPILIHFCAYLTQLRPFMIKFYDLRLRCSALIVFRSL